MTEPTAPGPPGRVLMVDDRADNLLALEAVLEPLGAELVRAESGEEGLRALLSGDFAVIVLDVQMPGMDGFETARLIKARERTRLVPIIFLTAISGEADHHLQGYRSGAVDYVYKPFSPEALRAKVSVFLELRRQGDLLERQRAQLADQLLELDRLNGDLERSNAALERLAAAAAIEIQEPLDNTAGLLDLLGTRHGAAVSEEGALLLTRAQANVATVRDRVTALLEYARLSDDGLRLDRVALADVVAEAAGTSGLRGGTLARGVELVVGDLPAVRGHRARLVTLFGHLLENAVLHGGSRPLTVRVTADAGPAAVTVTVADDGEGIPVEQRPRLFTLLPLGERDGNGSAGPASARSPAGLAVCRRIVEGHGGTIWSESPEAHGAVIRLTLPAVRVRDGAATVLVADDDPDYRLVVRLGLDGAPGFAPVMVAADAAAAWSAVQEHRPDVVLLDVSLPGAFDLCARLAAHAAAPKLVLVSSRPPDELAAIAAATGATGYLGKDSAPSELPAAIADVLAVVDRLEAVLARAFNRLPADVRSVGEARRLVRRTLDGWCADEQLDDIALCVSELVTNAVVHAGSAPHVLVHVRGTAIHVEISDHSEVLPVLRGPGPEDPSGRGMGILGTLSDRWGSRRRSGGGKTVWFDIVRTRPVAATEPA